MGSTFRYLAVFAGKSFPERVRSEVIDAVRAHVLAGPYVEVESREQADRSVAVARTSSSRWVHVADERDSLAHDLSLFDRAGLLSADVGRPVVSMSVFDSDDISMILWKRGEVADIFAVATHLQLPLQVDEAAAHGDPASWAEVLPTDRGPEALRSCWDTPRLGIEDMAQEAADILGFDPNYWTGDLRTMERWPEEDDVWLHFAFAESHPRLSGLPKITTDPVFTKVTGGLITRRLVIELPLRSVGGPVSGLMIMCMGPGLTDGLVSLISVSIEECPGSWRFGIREAPAGHSVQVAICDSCEIPGALVADSDSEDPDFLCSLRATRRASSVRVRVAIEGIAKLNGSAELAIFAAPVGNLEDGTMLWGEVEIGDTWHTTSTRGFWSDGDPPPWLQELIQPPDE